MKNYKKGTHRIISPRETISKATRFLSDFGITRLADLTRLDYLGIPTFSCYRPNARSVAVSMGKGTSTDAAKASALMESVETWHAESIEAPLLSASMLEMGQQGRRILDLARVPTMYQRTLDPNASIQWIEGQDLYTGASTWAPYELVHTDYTRPRRPGEGIYITSSNGLASGNCMTEALNHAITEVVERDGNTFWELGEDYMASKNRLQLSAIQDGEIQALLQCYQKVDMRVAVWDMSNDIGIPAFICWIMERGSRTGVKNRSFTGAGCHAVKQIALSRALTEAAQDRLALISGARDDLDPDEFGDPDPEIQAVRESIFEEIQANKNFDEIVNFTSDTLEEDLDWTLSKLADVGINQAVAFDLSKPRYGIAVAKVIIPGLEAPHDEAGYSPGARVQQQLGIF